MAPLQAHEIQKLRAWITQKEGHLHQPRLSSKTLGCGIPQGAITEVSGNYQIEWILSFLSEHPNLQIFWIEKAFTLLPTALYQRGLDLKRFVFAESQDLFSVMKKTLLSGAFDCIVAPHLFQQERVLRALQLLSERSQMTVFLTSPVLKLCWPIALQFIVNRSMEGDFLIEVKKNRGSEA